MVVWVTKAILLPPALPGRSPPFPSCLLPSQGTQEHSLCLSCPCSSREGVLVL